MEVTWKHPGFRIASRLQVLIRTSTGDGARATTGGSPDVGRLLARAEDELADLMDGMGQSRTADDDRAVLTRLSRLAAEVERSVARTTFRFGAAAAYYRLVRQRIEDLREARLPGFSPIAEFVDRRLVPAIDTCASIARRQDDLSARIAVAFDEVTNG
mgnify:CR=1 FL=1